MLSLQCFSCHNDIDENNVEQIDFDDNGVPSYLCTFCFEEAAYMFKEEIKNMNWSLSR